MFKRISATSDTITGTWRYDMPETIDRLKEVGFTLGILSSSQDGYIEASLKIYEQQFSADASGLFEEVLSTRRFDELGSKTVAFPEVASIASAQDKKAVFIDDKPPLFSEDVSFGVVNVTPEYQYQEKPLLSYSATWV